MKKFIVPLIVVIITNGATYMAVKHYVYKTAYANGKSVGFESGRAEGYNAGSVVAQSLNKGADQELINKNNELVQKYNLLVDDYNSLSRSKSYSRTQPVTCDSSTIGFNSSYSSTHVNCY